jgi:hypothetical protein
LLLLQILTLRLSQNLAVEATGADIRVNGDVVELPFAQYGKLLLSQ